MHTLRYVYITDSFSKGTSKIVFLNRDIELWSFALSYVYYGGSELWSRSWWSKSYFFDLKLQGCLAGVRTRRWCNLWRKSEKYFIYSFWRWTSDIQSAVSLLCRHKCRHHVMSGVLILYLTYYSLPITLYLMLEPARHHVMFSALHRFANKTGRHHVMYHAPE